MTILNAYTIENYLYNIGDTLMMGNDTVKIESIVNVNGTVFFFLSKSNGYFSVKVSQDTTIAVAISPMPALLFHHHNKLLLEKSK